LHGIPFLFPLLFLNVGLLPLLYITFSENIALALTAATDFADYTDFMDDTIPERQQSVKSVAAFVFFHAHGCDTAHE